MNTPGATDALAEIASRGEAIVGAGTILAPEQVKEAYDAGAEFIVTPVVLPEVVEAAHARGADCSVLQRRPRSSPPARPAPTG